MKKFTNVFVVFIFVGMLLLVVGCDMSSTQKKGQKEQENTMERARAAVPTPQSSNFLTRKAVARWMTRMDVPSKLFYIYVTTDSGAPIGYFIAQYRPVSTSTFLTPTKRIASSYSYNPVLPAPALDGTYYGSGGAANQYFWFDAETDAMIELKGYPYILSDQPLSLDAPRIYVQPINDSK